MNAAEHLIGIPEDVQAFGDQLTRVYDKGLFVVGAVARHAIRATLDPNNTDPMSVRYDRYIGDTKWHDIDAVSPYMNAYLIPRSKLELGVVPVDRDLDDFFSSRRGQLVWTSHRPEQIALGKGTLRPFVRRLNGFPVRTFSAGVQDWVNQQVPNYSHLAETRPSYKNYAEFMAALRANPRAYNAARELPNLPDPTDSR